MHKKDKQQNYYKKLFLFLLLMPVIGAGFYWLALEWSIIHAYIFGSDKNFSKSAKTKDLKFIKSGKHKDNNGEDIFTKKEWLLRIPNNYIISTLGRNGTSIFSKKENFSVILSATINPLNYKIKPEKLSNHDEIKNNMLSIYLKNNYSIIKREDDNACIPKDPKLHHDLNIEINHKNKNTYLYRECRLPNCQIFLNYNGWDVSFTLNKREQINYKKYCPVVREFLDKYTINTVNN